MCLLLSWDLQSGTNAIFNCRRKYSDLFAALCICTPQSFSAVRNLLCRMNAGKLHFCTYVIILVSLTTTSNECGLPFKKPSILNSLTHSQWVAEKKFSFSSKTSSNIDRSEAKISFHITFLTLLRIKEGVFGNEISKNEWMDGYLHYGSIQKFPFCICFHTEDRLQ